MALVFVYGPLLRGERNHGYLAAARYAGEASTRPGFKRPSLGRFPALVRGGPTRVVGEAYEVRAATLAALDALEGRPTFYRRETITLDSGLDVEAYLLRAWPGAAEPSGPHPAEQPGGAGPGSRRAAHPERVLASLDRARAG